MNTQQTNRSTSFVTNLEKGLSQITFYEFALCVLFILFIVYNLREGGQK